MNLQISSKLFAKPMAEISDFWPENKAKTKAAHQEGTRGSVTLSKRWL